MPDHHTNQTQTHSLCIYSLRLCLCIGRGSRTHPTLDQGSTHSRLFEHVWLEALLGGAAHYEHQLCCQCSVSTYICNRYVSSYASQMSTFGSQQPFTIDDATVRHGAQQYIITEVRMRIHPRPSDFPADKPDGHTIRITCAIPSVSDPFWLFSEIKCAALRGSFNISVCILSRYDFATRKDY